MNQKSSKKSSPLGTISIALILLGIIAEPLLLLIGVPLLVIHFVLKKQIAREDGKKTQESSAFSQPVPHKASQKHAAPRKFSQPVRPKDVSEAHRTERNADEHRIGEPEEYRSEQRLPHATYSDLERQARSEIANLRNIRYARSELSGKTLSDTVLWHNNSGVCSSVVQVIRQGNLRYPDLSDRELSQRILADEDLMQHLVRSLEWERSTELRWSET